MTRFPVVLAGLLVLAYAIGSAAPVKAQDPNQYRSSAAQTRFVDTKSARYAYRIYGPSTGIALLLINRFRGTLDDWDPKLLDILASGRRVIAFDNAGFAGSSGEPPKTLEGLANDTAAFLDALGIRKVDVLGFSYGGYTAQQLVLNHPELVRRLILASSGPGFVDNTANDPEVFKVAGKAVNSKDDLLYLFFKNTPSSRQAGEAYLKRVNLRQRNRDAPVAGVAIMAQLAASQQIGTAATSFVTKGSSLTLPVLLADGSSDLLIPPQRAYTLFCALPNAKLVIYPDSGHGFLFQYPTEFGQEVRAFLDGS
jgi:pimeloyl-ACP methyl ester carboxylesterase